MSASNVVRLPTAARRKVQQKGNKHTRAAMRELRKEWSGEYICPQVRAKLADAAALMLVERTPALLLSIALFQALTEEKKAEVRAQCDMLRFTGVEARGAATMIELRTIGESVDLDAACRLLREGRVADPN